MRSALVLLERNCVLPKHVWRTPSCRRTLAPIEIGPFVADAWKSCRDDPGEPTVVLISLETDGSGKRGSSVQRARFVGVFEISFVSLDQVKVILREEACAR